jgi:hypothetical protein
MNFVYAEVCGAIIEGLERLLAESGRCPITVEEGGNHPNVRIGRSLDE